MHHILAQVLIAIGLSVAAVALLRRISLPPVLAYLFVGVALGPYAAGVLQEGPAISLLGEIGVAFMLFAIGLEFSFEQFMSMRRVLLGLGGAQVLVGTISGALIAWSFGTPTAAAIVVGGALAMSSTAIVVKQLSDQLELQSRHGNLALGILLFQDLAAVPFLVVIPILAAGQTDGLWGDLGIALLKGVAAFGLLIALGRFALRPLFHEVAQARSMELFTVTVLFVSLFAAWVTEQLGLSLVLGAFLAGMMLSETEYRHQIEAELRPFKDVLLGLFFITVGMRLDLSAMATVWPWVLLLVIGLVIGKGGLITLLGWFWGRDKIVALRTGIVLGHGGEFGFALLALALGTGLLQSADAQPILAGIIVSMLIAPMLVRHNQQLAGCALPVAEPSSEADTNEIASVVGDQSRHIVLCGFGRVGRQIAALFEQTKTPFVASDLHAETVKDAWEDGRRVFYGDASQIEVLRALRVSDAAAVVISFNDIPAARRTVHNVRQIDREVPVLIRSSDDAFLAPLLAAGATEVVPETFETSLTLAGRVLEAAGVPKTSIDTQLATIRAERYHRIRSLKK